MLSHVRRAPTAVAAQIHLMIAPRVRLLACFAPARAALAAGVQEPSPAPQHATSPASSLRAAAPVFASPSSVSAFARAAWAAAPSRSPRAAAAAAGVAASTSRRFHASTVAAAAAPAVPPTTIEDDASFHDVADETLEELETALQPLDDVVEGFDMTCAMGVLTFKLGAQGTYVINKQTPNRQLWWSSPVSGPRRYHYVSAEGSGSGGSWVSTRDGHSMLASLKAEIKALTGEELKL